MEGAKKEKKKTGRGRREDPCETMRDDAIDTRSSKPIEVDEHLPPPRRLIESWQDIDLVSPL